MAKSDNFCFYKTRVYYNIKLVRALTEEDVELLVENEDAQREVLYCFIFSPSNFTFNWIRNKQLSVNYLFKELSYLNTKSSTNLIKRINLLLLDLSPSNFQKEFF